MLGLKTMALLAEDAAIRLDVLLCDRSSESAGDRADRLASAGAARLALDAALERLESACGAARSAIVPEPEPEPQRQGGVRLAEPQAPASRWQRTADECGETLLILRTRRDVFGVDVACGEYAVREADADGWIRHDAGLSERRYVTAIIAPTAKEEPDDHR